MAQTKFERLGLTLRGQDLVRLAWVNQRNVCGPSGDIC